MNLRHYYFFLGLVFLSVFFLGIVWEFWFEDRVLVDVLEDYEPETAAEHWRYIFSISLFVLISLVFPAIIGHRLITQQQYLIAEVRHLADHDHLTGLGNRRRIQQVLDDELVRCERYDCDFAVIMLDIDHFKRINDSLGHKAGDDLLVAIAGLLERGVRDSDIPGRWGGEEFIVVCPQTDTEGAVRLAEKLRGQIEAAGLGGTAPVTASFGIGGYRRGDSLERLIGRADAAMYAAKQGGRNRVEVSA